MAKIFFILLAILFIRTSIYGDKDDGILMKLKNGVEETAEKAYSLLRQKLSEYSGKIMASITKLKEEASDLHVVAYGIILFTENQTMAAIDEIIKGATGTDVEQCKNMTKSLKPIVSETLADAYNCVDSRVKTAVDTWKDLYQRSQESLKALIQVKNDVEDCVEGDTNWRTSLCVSKVSAVGSWEAVTNVPHIIFDIISLYSQIKSFFPEIRECVSSESMQNYRETIEQLKNNILNCVQAELNILQPTNEPKEATEKSWIKKYFG